MINEVIEQLNVPGKLIYLSQFGSHLYGLNTENSDLDFRGIYIPNLDDIILHKDKDEINEEIELLNVKGMGYKFNEKVQVIPENTWLKLIKVDVKIFSLQKFITLCSKADTNALDLLFSINNGYIEQYGAVGICEIFKNRNKLINTDRLESPITYAFKQATRFGIKGERLSALEKVLEKAKYLKNETYLSLVRTPLVSDLIPHTDLMELGIPSNHLRIDHLDNKGKIEDYLFVCGVLHQFNTTIDTFIQRIEEKINKEYTSERTKNAKDGNDWKSLSHAVRVLLEVQELMETGNIQFPLEQKDFLLDIKLGKVKRELIDEFFKSHLSGLMECMEQNTLGWKYDEKFWNNFILKETR